MPCRTRAAGTISAISSASPCSESARARAPRWSTAPARSARRASPAPTGSSARRSYEHHLRPLARDRRSSRRPLRPVAAFDLASSPRLRPRHAPICDGPRRPPLRARLARLRLAVRGPLPDAALPRGAGGLVRLRTTPHLKRSTLARARTLRREMTEAERVLWNGLRECFRPVYFRHQVPFGPYYADFASHGARLAIEVDGGQHCEALDYDAARTKFLEGEGYRVLRFWNNEVLENLDGVLTVIAAAAPESLSPLVGERLERGVRGKAPRAPRGAHPHPSPPHKGEGGNDNLRLESD